MPSESSRSKLFLGTTGSSDLTEQAHNQQAWDRLVEQSNRFTKPANDQDFSNPLAVVDGCGWLGGDIRNRRVLCLAAGGGRQGPLYSAAGAQVTVVDISHAMLAIDREVAAERQLNLQTVMTSMDDLSMFDPASFDIVVQPVSTCYVADIQPVYREIARILVDGGLYISQHKQPVSLQLNQQCVGEKYFLEHSYYRNEPLPAGVPGSLVRETGTREYLHRWEQLLGWMCRAGFAIEDLVEPVHAKSEATAGSFGHHSQFVAPYVRIKARRQSSRG